MGRSAKNKATKKSKKFFDLTAEKNMSSEDLSWYKEALDFAIENPEIKNLALTGIYSSGKSSIIESYKKSSKKAFIHISLAHFKFEKSRTKEKEDDSIQASSQTRVFKLKRGSDEKTLTEKQKVLEGQILNQLLHQIKTARIPQTIFRVKNHKNIFHFILISIWILMLLLSLGIFFDIKSVIDNLDYILHFFSLPSSSGDYIKTVNVFLLFILCLGCMITLVRLQVNHKLLKGVSIKNPAFESNIEVFSKTEDSYFDKYLDDVLYLFVQSGADIIIFEDIDRFDANSIFEKLKEINTLVNNRLSKKMRNRIAKRLEKTTRFPRVTQYLIHRLSKKQIFLYLLKDEMFFSKDRTKFFDMIIPVIPVMTSANSYETLLKCIKDAEIEHAGENSSFDRNFLQKLSLFIDDLRLMKNIINEYAIYAGKLKVDALKLNRNKLLAMMAVKSIFPEEYSDLLLGNGFIHTVFAQKKNFIYEQSEAILSNIKSRQDLLRLAEEEHLKDVAELDFLYLQYEYRINPSYAPDFTEGIKGYIDTLRSSDVIYQMTNRSSVQMDPTELFESMESDKGYQERKIVIESKMKTRNDEIKYEIKIFENKKAQLEHQNLKDIVTRDQLREILRNKDFSSVNTSSYSELLVFLLFDGYIDETYADYITFFYEEGLRTTDKLFLRSITEDIPLPVLHPLTQDQDTLTEVLGRITASDYLKKSTLNVDLFTAVIAKENDENKQKNYVLTIERNLDFYYEYYSQIIYHGERPVENGLYTNDTVEKLIKFTNSYNIEIVRKLIKFMTDREFLSYFIEDYIWYTTKEELKDKDSYLGISQFISDSEIFLSNVKAINKSFLEKLNLLQPKFRYLDTCEEILSELFEYVIECDLYEINRDNLFFILKRYDNTVDLDDFEHRNLDLVLGTSKNQIGQYMKDNIDEYLSEYIDFSGVYVADDSEASYYLLNNDIDGRLIDAYFEKSRTGGLSTTKIPSRNYNLVLTNNLALPTEETLLNYYESTNGEWTSTLIDFINKNEDNLAIDKSKLSNHIEGNELYSDFLTKIISQHGLSIKAYSKLITSINRTCHVFKEGALSDEKISFLLKQKKIKLNEVSLSTFRDNYSEFLIEFITGNWRKYIEYLDNLTEITEGIEDELVNVLKGMTRSIKTLESSILDILGDREISIVGLKVSDDTIVRIIDEHLKRSDLKVLFSNYTSYRSSIRKKIQFLIKKEIVNGNYESYSIHKQLFEDLMSEPEEHFSTEQKKKVLALAINNLSNEEIVKYLKEVKLGEIINAFGTKQRPTVTDTESNLKVVVSLKNKGLLLSYKREQNQIRLWGTTKQKV